MKYHIEKNTVQETLVIPLYGRKMCSELYPNLYLDETALRLMEQIDYDFSLLSQKSKSLMQQFGFLEAAMRQNDLAWEVRDYLREHPNAAVVNLGCGLDDTGRSCDNGSCRIYNLDFPGVIAVREYTPPPAAPTATAGIINEISRIKAPPRQRRGRCPHRPGRMHRFYGSLRQIRNFPLGRQSCWPLQRNFIFSRIP